MVRNLKFLFSCVCRDFQLVKDLNVDLKYVINTHLHADHVTGESQTIFNNMHDPMLTTKCHCCVYAGTGRLKALHSAHISTTLSAGHMSTVCKSAISAAAGATADVLLKDCDKIVFGSRHLSVLATPGHTEVLSQTLLSFTLVSVVLLFRLQDHFLKPCVLASLKWTTCPVLHSHSVSCVPVCCFRVVCPTCWTTTVWSLLEMRCLFVDVGAPIFRYVVRTRLIYTICVRTSWYVAINITICGYMLCHRVDQQRHCTTPCTKSCFPCPPTASSTPRMTTRAGRAPLSGKKKR